MSQRQIQPIKQHIITPRTFNVIKNWLNFTRYPFVFGLFFRLNFLWIFCTPEISWRPSQYWFDFKNLFWSDNWTRENRKRLMMMGVLKIKKQKISDNNRLVYYNIMCNQRICTTNSTPDKCHSGFVFES